MTKCAVCQTKKGKRECSLAGGVVCSLCCGQTRKEEACAECEYYRPPDLSRRYADVPRYSTQEMEIDPDLQSHAHAVEAALCLWDHEQGRELKDASALKVIEMLLARYHFKEDPASKDDDHAQAGFNEVSQVISTDLSDIPEEKIVKILGAIRFVARRRSRGRREYLDFIHEYVGTRVGPGMRALPMNR